MGPTATGSEAEIPGPSVQIAFPNHGPEYVISPLKNTQCLLIILKESQASQHALLLGFSSLAPSTTKWTIYVSYCKISCSPCTRRVVSHLRAFCTCCSLCMDCPSALCLPIIPSSASKLGSTVKSLESPPFLLSLPLWLSLSASLVTSLCPLVLFCACGDCFLFPGRNWV